jgi:hypothetical protein
MNASTRLSVCSAGLLALTSLGLLAAYGGSVYGLAAQVAGLAEAEQCIEEEGQNERDLDRRSQAVLRRLAARERIAGRVADGTLTLHAAACRFRALNRQAPEYQTAFRYAFAGPSDDERLCRQVIEWTHGVARCKLPSRATEIVRHLESELAEEVKRDGRIHLPDSGACPNDRPDPHEDIGFEQE